MRILKTIIHVLILFDDMIADMESNKNLFLQSLNYF